MTCSECESRGWVRTGLSDVKPCTCAEGLLFQLDEQRDRILGLACNSTDEDRDDVDAIDREIIIYASLRARFELRSVLDEDDWRICSTTKIIRERIAALEVRPVQ